MLLELAAWLHERTGDRELAMAGGVALNCVANSRVWREGPFERIWVQPAAVDEVAGTPALGVPPAGADLAVNLHGRGPESHRAILAAGPRRMIAFACERAGWVPAPAWRGGEHEVRRWCRLLAESGIPADPAGLELPAPRGDAAVPGATVIHPGAASAARRWPPERWAAVARAERARGRRVLVTGSAGERALAETVARGGGLAERDVLAGRTGLLELGAVVAAAGRVLCGDTGVAHLATAFGVPSVLRFGPTPPGEWGPPPGRVRHVVLHRGGRGDPHADTPDPGLLAIAVQDVLDVTSSGFPAVAGRPREWESPTRSRDASSRPPATSPTTPLCGARDGSRSARARPKDEMARAEERADAKADEVADLERKT